MNDNDNDWDYIEWYYVATVVIYVLVQAKDIDEARTKGQIELNKMIDNINPKMSKDIKTVRLADAGEISLYKFHLKNIERFGTKE